MGALEGKVAVITGSTSGIGARTAELFVAEGARVVIAGRREEKGRQLARALGEAASFIRTDVSNEPDVQAMIAHAVNTFGRLDCLMNNAGSGSGYQEIPTVDLKRFDEVIAVHVRGALAAMKYAVPVMAEQRSGSIINVASVNGIRAGLGGHYYAAAKATSIHLTRCAAVELGEKGIRVNSISPGMIATGAFGKYSGMQVDEADDHPELAEVKRRYGHVPLATRIRALDPQLLALSERMNRYTIAAGVALPKLKELVQLKVAAWWVVHFESTSILP